MIFFIKLCSFHLWYRLLFSLICSFKISDSSPAFLLDSLSFSIFFSWFLFTLMFIHSFSFSLFSRLIDFFILFILLVISCHSFKSVILCWYYFYYFYFLWTSRKAAVLCWCFVYFWGVLSLKLIRVFSSLTSWSFSSYLLLDLSPSNWVFLDS